MDIGQTYLRGQIWYAKFPYDYKKEGRGDSVVRPVLILSNNALNKDKNKVLVAPFTKQELDETPLHMPFHFNRNRSILLVDNMKTVMKEDFEGYEFTLSEGVMEKVDDAVLMAVGLKEIPDVGMKDFDIDEEEEEEDLSEYYNMSRPTSSSKRRYFNKEKKKEFISDYNDFVNQKMGSLEIIRKYNLNEDEDLEDLYLKFRESLEI